jgi:hypothetical protein
LTGSRDRAVAGPGQSGVGPESRLADRTLAARAERECAVMVRSGLDQEQRRGDAGDESGGGPSALEDPYREAMIRLPQVAGPEELARLARPSLLIVGGTATAARLLAKQVGERRGGNVREISNKISAGDFAAVLAARDEADVLFLASIDYASSAVVDLLTGVLADYALDVQIGTGPTTRTLRLDLKRFFVLARSGSGKVPEPLASWGGLLVSSWETKLCPRCAEEVKMQALVCRFCGHDFAEA